jgi:myosin-1
MRVNLLGETSANGSKPHIRALSETKAIATGANFISEAFLFTVALSLIMAESYRSYRKEGKRRDLVAERLETLEESV